MAARVVPAALILALLIGGCTTWRGTMRNTVEPLEWLFHRNVAVSLGQGDVEGYVALHTRSAADAARAEATRLLSRFARVERSSCHIERLIIAPGGSQATVRCRLALAGLAPDGTRLQVEQRWLVRCVTVPGDWRIDAVAVLRGGEQQAGAARFGEQAAERGLVLPAGFGQGGDDEPFAAVGDVDGDTLDDLLLGAGDRLLLYRNTGGRLQLQSGERGLQPLEQGTCLGAWFADVDGDGDADLYAAMSGAEDRLYLNDGTGAFSERTAREFGIDPVGPTRAACFADFDGDGDLDLYLCHGGPPELAGQHGESSGWRGAADQFFSNLGAGAGDPRPGATVLPAAAPLVGDTTRPVTSGSAGRHRSLPRFESATVRAGLDQAPGMDRVLGGVACCAFDLEGDGDLDLYVATEGPADRVFRNRGDGRFDELSAELGLSLEGRTRCIDPVDATGDGQLDLLLGGPAGRQRWVAALPGHPVPAVFPVDVLFEQRLLDRTRQQWQGNRLMAAADDGRFVEQAAGSGLALTGSTRAALLFDVDCDGDLDCYAVNGAGSREAPEDGWSAPPARSAHDGTRGEGVPPAIGPSGAAVQRNVTGPRQLDDLERNRLLFHPAVGSRHWVEGAWVAGCDLPEPGAGLCLLDLEHDGDLDLLVVNRGSPPALLVNQGPSGHWLELRLRATVGHPDALGARVVLQAGGRRQERQLVAGRGAHGSQSRELHFGLGAAERIDWLELHWPSGRVERFTDLPADRLLQLTEVNAPRGE